MGHLWIRVRPVSCFVWEVVQEILFLLPDDDGGAVVEGGFVEEGLDGSPQTRITRTESNYSWLLMTQHQPTH